MTRLLRIGLVVLAASAAHGVLADPVDINCADAATLASGLKGIGEAKAQAIVAQREKAGLFKTADDLTSVKGIGAKTVDANRSNITVSENCPGAAPAKPE